MTKTWNKLKEIIKKDPRYSLQAYQFVFEALDYTTNMLGKNQHKTTDQDRHVTGRQLLEGIRQYASKQFGFMALTVFEEWGINQDADFGNIVFNLVENGLMGKTGTDSREDFKNIYDLKKVFDEEFKFDGSYDIRLSLNALGIKKIITQRLLHSENRHCYLCHQDNCNFDRRFAEYNGGLPMTHPLPREIFLPHTNLRTIPKHSQPYHNNQKDSHLLSGRQLAPERLCLDPDCKLPLCYQAVCFPMDTLCHQHLGLLFPTRSPWGVVSQPIECKQLHHSN